MHIGHLALRVADLDAYASHASAAIGLVVHERDEAQVLLGCQPDRNDLQLIAAEEPAFDHVGFAVDTVEQLDALIERAVDAGGSLSADHPAEPGCEHSAFVVGPGGISHQLYVPSQPAPLTAARNLGTAMRRFGHLTFFSSASAEIVRFWQEGLGFRVSDVVGDFVWLRCDAFHHSLAVGPRADGTVLHHHAWEIQDVAALTKYCDLNGLAGRPQAWGPVRHGPGFNLATYMPDAAGAMIEVYADLLIIEDDTNYVPVDWSNEPLALNLWGTMPAPEVWEAGLPVTPAEASLAVGGSAA